MNKIVQVENDFEVHSWGTPSANLRLNNDMVHIWRALLDQSETTLRLLEAKLSDDERARAGSLQGKSRDCFVSSRGILRAILGYYVQLRPEEIRFSYAEHGKPSLSEDFGGPEVCFNLAHSHEMALYAVTKMHGVGVDLEKIIQIPQLEAIAKRFLSSRENDEILKLGGYARLFAFFQVWTRKEAYLKARGLGISHLSNEIQDFYGSFSSYVRGLIPAPGFVAAVAGESPVRYLDFFTW